MEGPSTDGGVESAKGGAAVVAEAFAALHDVFVRHDDPSLQMIQAIVQKNPDVTRSVFGKDEWTALHYALYFEAPQCIITYLANKNRRALEMKSVDGHTPIHIAARCGARLETVKYLVKRYKRALLEKTNKGETPLYCAVAYKNSDDIIIKHLAAEEPRALLEPNIVGLLPLHRAAELNFSLPTVRFLTITCRRALRERTEDGLTPLHYASWHADLGVVQLLTDEFPGALQMKSVKGERPLDCAAWKNGPEVVKFLADRNRAALMAKTKLGCVPLHFAALFNSVEVVQLLLMLNPEAAKVLSCVGGLALHYAAKKGDPESVRALVAAYPEALLVENNEGHRPIQVAVDSWSTDEERMAVLSTLLEPQRPPLLPLDDPSRATVMPCSPGRTSAKRNDCVDGTVDENRGLEGTGDDDKTGLIGATEQRPVAPATMSRSGCEVCAPAASSSLEFDDGHDERVDKDKGGVDERQPCDHEAEGLSDSSTQQGNDDDLPPLVSATPVPRNGCWVLSPSSDDDAVNLQYAVVQGNEIVFDRVVTRSFRGGSHLIHCSSGTRAYVYEPMPRSVPSLWQVSLATSFGGSSIPAMPLYQLPFDPSKSELLANPKSNDVWVLTKEGGTNWLLFEATFRGWRHVPLLELTNRHVKLVAADDAGGWLHIEGSVDDAERPGALAPGLLYVFGDTHLPTRPEPLRWDDRGKDVHFTSTLEGHGVWALSLRNEASGSARCKLSLVTVEGEDDEARIVSRTKTLDFPFHRVRHVVAAPGGVFLHCNSLMEGGDLTLLFASLDSSEVTSVVHCPRSCLLPAKGGCWLWKKVGGGGEHARRPRNYSLSFVDAEERAVVVSKRTFPAGSVISAVAG